MATGSLSSSTTWLPSLRPHQPVVSSTLRIQVTPKLRRIYYKQICFIYTNHNVPFITLDAGGCEALSSPWPLLIMPSSVREYTADHCLLAVIACPHYPLDALIISAPQPRPPLTRVAPNLLHKHRLRKPLHTADLRYESLDWQWH